MLTDKDCQNLKLPKGEKYKSISDANGMYLEVSPSGSKCWRLSYRYAGAQKRIALGVYPEVSLKEAREKRDELRKILKSGSDPAEARKKQKIETIENSINTFENIAREWFEKKKPIMAERHAFYVIRRLEANIFPFLGSSPIKKIAPKDLLAVIRQIEARGSLEGRASNVANCWTNISVCNCHRPS